MKSSSSSSSMIKLSIRSSVGRRRISVPSGSSVSALLSSISDALELTPDSFVVRRDDDGKPGSVLRTSNKFATITSMRIKNGDSLYVTDKDEKMNGVVLGNGGFNSNEESSNSLSSVKSSASLNYSGSSSSLLRPNSSAMSLSTTMATAGSSASLSSLTSTLESLTEDDVDICLRSQDGRIEVGQGPNCNHGAKQKCLYCTAKEPYDESVLRARDIKHMSFHSYLRKLASGSDKGKFAALKPTRCLPEPNCRRCGLNSTTKCSLCQPAAITLNRQNYRHVDIVMFENKAIVDNFLAYWRTTGHQRLGFLIGRYEPFDGVPLGIKAVVAAIYEPPQTSNRDGIKLELEDPKELKVGLVANALGLQCVGWVFTDLVADKKSGGVRNTRGVDTHFLSAQECITAGVLQSRHPNVCRDALDGGRFGSKFVTVCITGDSNNQVHMEGYMVSNQGMALARDGCLVPTKDAPELGYVPESSAEKFVPDVFYREKDKYGNEVMKAARPLPLEYLLVDVPVSTPLEPLFTFVYSKNASFPIENRQIDGHIQDLSALAKFKHQLETRHFDGDDHNDDMDELLKFFTNFHLLLYLCTQTTVDDLADTMEPLIEAVRNKDVVAVHQFAASPQWQTIELLMQAQDG